jgi:hypothetical protein
MKGTVLNVDSAGGGLLRAEDGRRYEFATGEWKTPRAPVVGEEVDFEPVSLQATAIYALRPGGSGAAAAAAALRSMLPPASGASPPQFTAALLDDWRPILAIAGLVACLLPYFSMLGHSANLFSLPGLANDLRSMIGSAAAPLVLTYLLYVIPLAAGAVLFMTYTGRSAATAGLVHGVASLGIPLFIGFAVPVALGVGVSNNASLFGFGTWILMLVGAGQIAVSAGLVTKAPRDVMPAK